MKNKKLNNDGSTLVIVIILIAFVSILTTTLLYLANMNYQMKATDYRTKVSFYGSEVPMEEIRMQLTADAANATEEVYKEMLVNYGNYTSDDGGLRQAKFQELFLNKVYTDWETRSTVAGTPPSISWKQGIEIALNHGSNVNVADNLEARGYHVVVDDCTDNVYCTDTACTANCHIVLNDSITGDRLEKDSINGCLKLKGIRVVYTENSFTSVIETDFMVEVPNVDMTHNSYKDDDSLSTDRTTVDFETCVYYTNWVKQ